MRTPNDIPIDQIRIFGRDGTPLAQFRAFVERSWAIGEEGRALFAYPSRNTDVVDDRVLRFGNWILIENSAMPEPWIGIIDTPRKWASRTVNVYCYGPIHLFTFIRGQDDTTFSGASAGTLFRQLLDYANSQEATILQAGNIWEGGPEIEIQLRPAPLGDFMRELINSSGEEVSFRPITDANGKLIVFVDWSEKLGIQTPLILQEGRGGGNIELTEDEFIEDGPIVNDALGYGDGLTWDAKPKSNLIDADSRKKYGLRQDSVELVGYSSPTAIQNATQVYLDAHSEPTQTYTINALNRGDTFKYLSMGNEVTLVLESVGFGNDGTRGISSQARIIGKHYTPDQKGKLALTLQQVL